MERIAEQLNRKGVLTPLAYKKSIGLKYRTGFGTAEDSQWNQNMVRRILKNRIYVGDLEQGKRYKPNYKVDVVVTRPPEEWVVVKNHHEPIIDLHTFEAVQRDMRLDSRCCDATNLAPPLSGVVQCADCGMTMVQKRVDRGRKQFYYYVCSGHNRKMCGSSDRAFHPDQSHLHWLPRTP